MQKRPAFKSSAETNAIMERIRRAVIGEVVTYPQILDLGGFKTLDEARPYINSARRQLWREHIYTSCERGAGILRTDGDGAGRVTLRGEENLTRRRRRLCQNWRDIVDASAETLAIKTRQLYKHEMLGALDKLFRRPEMQHLPEKRSVIDPRKVIELFKKKAS